LIRTFERKGRGKKTTTKVDQRKKLNWKVLQTLKKSGKGSQHPINQGRLRNLKGKKTKK